MDLAPIAYLRSPYKQKFAIPRQPNLVREAVGEIVFEPNFADPNCLRGIERFTHLWLLFVFHGTVEQGWTPTVTPPRLGGSQRTGVFASRSTFRPNPLGLSVVEYLDHGLRPASGGGQQLVLRVRGVDMLDGTPVLDIKPYLPYADAVTGASGGYAEEAPCAPLDVCFSSEAHQQLERHGQKFAGLEAFITGVLRQDPRPAVHVRQERPRQYAMFLYDLNIRWQVEGTTCTVICVEPVDTVTPDAPA